MEDVLIPVVVFSSLLLFLKMMLDYARFRHEHKSGTGSATRDGASNSLAVSELEDLIEAAVEHAVRPLERRIRRLERTGHAAASGTLAPEPEDSGAESKPVLDELDDYDQTLTSRGGNVYDVGSARPRVRRH